jgi:hypothetical protein
LRQSLLCFSAGGDISLGRLYWGRSWDCVKCLFGDFSQSTKSWPAGTMVRDLNRARSGPELARSSGHWGAVGCSHLCRVPCVYSDRTMVIGLRRTFVAEMGCAPHSARPPRTYCGRGIRRVSLFGGSLWERLQAQCTTGTDGAGRSTSNFRIAVFKSALAAVGHEATLTEVLRFSRDRTFTRA